MKYDRTGAKASWQGYETFSQDLLGYETKMRSGKNPVDNLKSGTRQYLPEAEAKGNHGWMEIFLGGLP